MKRLVKKYGFTLFLLGLVAALAQDNWAKRVQIAAYQMTLRESAFALQYSLWGFAQDLPTPWPSEAQFRKIVKESGDSMSRCDVEREFLRLGAKDFKFTSQ